jgi:hypothetical protein
MDYYMLLEKMDDGKTYRVIFIKQDDPEKMVVDLIFEHDVFEELLDAVYNYYEDWDVTVTNETFGTVDRFNVRNVLRDMYAGINYN